MSHEGKGAEFSCCSQLQLDLRIEYPRSNNGLALVFPLLDVYVLEAVKQESAAFSGESEGNRDLRESSSVNAHSRSGPLQDHVTINVLHQGENELSLCHHDISV